KEALRLSYPIRFADAGAAADMLGCERLALFDGFRGDARPVCAFIVQQPDENVDPWMQRIGSLQKPEQVLGIGRRDEADDIYREQVWPCRLDAADRGNAFEKIHCRSLCWPSL